MWLYIFVIIIIAICVAMTWTQGLWTNLISLFNAAFAGVFASNYFEPLAQFLESQAESYTYFWDFLSIWMIFSFAFLVLRTATDGFSKTRVRFRLPVETFGSPIAAALTGWVVVSVFLFSLHTAPLPRNSFGGAFQKTPTSSNFPLSPDRLWLGFLQSRSEGVLATAEKNVFDPNSEFILRYGERRERFSQEKTMRVR
jgi:hypothetical protein